MEMSMISWIIDEEAVFKTTWWQNHSDSVDDKQLIQKSSYVDSVVLIGHAKATDLYKQKS